MITEIPSISRVPTLLSEGKAICGFIDTVRFHTTLRCRKELFMLYKDCTSTGESLYFLYFREKEMEYAYSTKRRKAKEV